MNILLGLLIFGGTGFVVGYFYRLFETFEHVFNSEYILEQKNIKSLDSLWKKVHKHYFFINELNEKVPEDTEPFTAEEVDILGTIRATFARIQNTKQEK